MITLDGVVCDRCHVLLPGCEAPGPYEAMTAGYYLAQAWPDFALPGEDVICDACMWASDLYRERYGHAGSV